MLTTSCSLPTVHCRFVRNSSLAPPSTQCRRVQRRRTQKKQGQKKRGQKTRVDRQRTKKRGSGGGGGSNGINSSGGGGGGGGGGGDDGDGASALSWELLNRLHSRQCSTLTPILVHRFVRTGFGNEVTQLVAAGECSGMIDYRIDIYFPRTDWIIDHWQSTGYFHRHGISLSLSLSLSLSPICHRPHLPVHTAVLTNRTLVMHPATFIWGDGHAARNGHLSDDDIAGHPALPIPRHCKL
jgi:hypothetical protein